MSMSHDKYKKELGKTCNTGMMTTLIAMLVTPRITGQQISAFDYVIMFFIAFFFGFLGFILLSEKDSRPKADGKWKRIRVKKDTTIHVMEETEG